MLATVIAATAAGVVVPSTSSLSPRLVAHPRRATVPYSSAAAVYDPASATLLASSAAAFALQSTPPGRLLSAPMLSFSLALGLSNVGLLPLAHPSYDLCTGTLLPISVCLGLLSTAAMPVEARGGSKGSLTPMLMAFTIGAFGTLLGALCAFATCAKVQLLPPTAAAAAAALLCATYIGGSANFFGVAAALPTEQVGALIPALLAADLGLMGLYFGLLAAAAQWPALQRRFPEAQTAAEPAAGSAAEAVVPATARGAPWVVVTAVLAAVVATLGGRAAERRLQLPGSAILLLSVASSASARLLAERRPVVAQQLRVLAAPSLLLSCLFLGSLGAAARLEQVLAAGPAAAVCAGIVLSVHCVTLLLGCGAANRAGAVISLRELLVASNANVGGSATAMAMATGRRWYDLLSAAAMCGTAGYASATLIGLTLFRLLVRAGG